MEEQNNREYLDLLAHKYKEGNLTEEETAYFERWYNSFDDEYLELPEGNSSNPVSIRERIQASLNRRIAEDKIIDRGKGHPIPLLWQRIIAAASIIIVVGLFLYNYYRQPTIKSPASTLSAINVTPGSSNAVLTLSNGRKISLSGSTSGMLAKDANVHIIKAAGGQIIYNAGKDANGNHAMNIIETPRGGEFQIVLPDGTKVWLNAASSLKYPVSFNERGKAGERRTRLVELSGEAYFQVAKDKDHPFIVKTDRQQVEVLGTHFNIQSYADGSVPTTTLTEGSVRLRSTNNAKAGSVILKPGQQAVATGDHFTVTDADLTTALAWKDGKLRFRDATLPQIMREVSRWYDIDIRYDGAIPDDLFTGGISRKSNLNSLLKIFEASQIKFKLEQDGNKRTLIVIP